MSRTVTGIPGVKTVRTATPRRVTMSRQGLRYLVGSPTIYGTSSRDPLNTGDVDVLRAGMVMGVISASGKYAPSVLGVTTAAYDKTGTSNTTMTVSAATATELNRRIGSSGTFNVTGPPTAAGTVATEIITYSAVDTATGAITITVAGADYVAGSFIQPTDGSETPLCLIDDGYGLKVTDEDDNSIDVPFPNGLMGGYIDASQLYGGVMSGTMDASLKTWLKATKLNAHGFFTFDDDYSA